MIVEVLLLEEAAAIRYDRSHWPPSEDWCPGGERRYHPGIYYPHLRAVLQMPDIEHAQIRYYKRKWYGRKAYYKVCPACDYTEEYTRFYAQRKEGHHGWRQLGHRRIRK